MGGLFFNWGASFLSGGGRPMGGHRFWWGGGVEKNRKMGGRPLPIPPTIGNPAITKVVDLRRSGNFLNESPFLKYPQLLFRSSPFGIKNVSYLLI